MELSLLQQLAVGAGLGFLVGLQREWSTREVAGIRTFPLITVLGVLSGALAEVYGGWIVAAALLGVAGMIWVGNLARMRAGTPDSGVTTEIAALVMFGVGATLAAGYTSAAVVVGGGVAVMLQLKVRLHDFARHMDKAELQAIIRLTLIALVILPLLPNRAFGPYGVLNPFEIWLMVVLIVGISFGAYLAYRVVGRRAGTVLAGVLGGLITSTATTVSYARRAKEQPALARGSALVVLIASTVVFGRVLIELAIVAPEHLDTFAAPIGIMMALMALLSAGLYASTRTRLGGKPDDEPPSDLKSAIGFGLLYALVLFAVAAAKEHFGEGALYAVAAVSGLTDVDAITLSTAQLTKAGLLDAAVGWRIVLVGALSNLVFKLGIVAVVGGRRLLRQVAPLFAIAIAGGVGLLLLWP